MKNAALFILVLSGCFSSIAPPDGGGDLGADMQRADMSGADLRPAVDLSPASDLQPGEDLSPECHGGSVGDCCRMDSQCPAIPIEPPPSIPDAARPVKSYCGPDAQRQVGGSCCWLYKYTFVNGGGATVVQFWQHCGNGWVCTEQHGGDWDAGIFSC